MERPVSFPSVKCGFKDAGSPVFLIIPLIRNNFSSGILKHHVVPDSTTSACFTIAAILIFHFFLTLFRTPLLFCVYSSTGEELRVKCCRICMPGSIEQPAVKIQFASEKKKS